MQLSSLMQAATWRRTLGLIALLAAAVFAERHLETDEVSELTGHPRLIDGDSLKMGGQEVRMVGIDAPEGRQQCQKQGRDWACGRAARRVLSEMIGGRSVRCRVEGRDKHRRLLGTCEVGGINLNKAMVERGFAVGFGRRYAREERAAKAARRGLWAGTFERPQEWRRQNLGSVDG